VGVVHSSRTTRARTKLPMMAGHMAGNSAGRGTFETSGCIRRAREKCCRQSGCRCDRQNRLHERCPCSVLYRCSVNDGVGRKFDFSYGEAEGNRHHAKPASASNRDSPRGRPPISGPGANAWAGRRDEPPRPSICPDAPSLDTNRELSRSRARWLLRVGRLRWRIVADGGLSRRTRRTGESGECPR
jgi:hypothetical protein